MDVHRKHRSRVVVVSGSRQQCARLENREQLYAAPKTRGKVRGALPRSPARGESPLNPRPLSLLFDVPERSSPSRVRCAAQKARALDCSGPFRKADWDEGKGPFGTAPLTLSSRWSA